MQNRDTLAVSEDRVVVGDWSADVGEVVAVSARLRGLLRDGRVLQAREMLNSPVPGGAGCGGGGRRGPGRDPVADRNG